MNLMKFFATIGLVSSFGLVACGSDSSSNSSPETPSSGSSATPIVLPESNGDTLVDISGFGYAYLNSTTLKFNGSVGINWDADTSVYIDSVAMFLGDENGSSIGANFSMKAVDYTALQSLSIGKQLEPVLDMESFEGCGVFLTYFVVYAHNNDAVQIVAKDTTVFEKSCQVVVSSSSVAASPTLTAWKVTLSTQATVANAVDLDSKTTYFVANRDANASTIDIYLGRNTSREPALFTNGALLAENASKIGEETGSGFNYADDPTSATMNEFRYNETKLSDVADDFELVTSYVVRTPAYDASTGKGFFVVLPQIPTKIGTSDYSVDLIVLGNWD